jgi:glycosyltransferase involved in cell wall biosynthesis
MKILHLTTSDIDSGAARATYRLHQGLQAIGVESQLLVRAKFSTDETVISEKTLITKLGPPLSSVPLKLYPKREQTMFSSQWFMDKIASRVAQLNPDIIHLHWICNGFLQVESLSRFKKPLVWTLDDLWPLTGGCHYPYECDRYMTACGRCPQLKSQKDWDLSRWIWQRKFKAWKNLNLTLVGPSHWAAECARTSSLFKDRRIEAIPYGLDTSVYKPVNQQTARSLLNLPQDKKLILYGAASGVTSDPRKGFQFLYPALKSLSASKWQDQLEVAVFGMSEPKTPIDLGLKSHYLGRFSDDVALSLVYSAADVMVVPSTHETFGQTASEALACGTPVVAFDVTGLKDFVSHQQNGYLAHPYEVEDLIKGITWVLEDDERLHKLGIAARNKAEQELSLEIYAHRHLSIYTEVSEASRKTANQTCLL